MSDNTKYTQEELAEELLFTLTVGETLRMYKTLSLRIRSKERELLRMKRKGAPSHQIGFSRATRQRLIDLRDKLEKLLEDFDQKQGKGDS